MTPIKTGMILAAGLGLRMRPITNDLPKPLIRIGDRTLLDHAIDRLTLAGIERIVVNVHYLASQIIDHLAARYGSAILISQEEVLLETGGAVTNALPLLGDEPFAVVNGDSLWLDSKHSAVARMAKLWNDERYDAILLMQRSSQAIGYDQGQGDFFLDQLGKPRRRKQIEVAPYIFAGVQLLSPQLFEDVPEGPFSLNLIYDRAIERERMGAIVHDGEWYHVGTPEGLKLVCERFNSHRAER